MPQQSTQIFEQRDSEVVVGGNGDLLASRHSGTTVGNLQRLWDSRTFLAGAVALGFVFSLVLGLIIPPKYESVTRLMPPEKSSEGLSMLAAFAGKVGDSGGLTELAGDMLGIKNSGALFVGMLHSRTVQDAIVARFDLRKLYGVPKWEDARKELDSRTLIWEDRKSGIIEVRVRDRSPRRAQELARAYVEELDHAVNKLTTSAARREREFLENRLIGVKHDLDQASQDFSQFASRNTAIDIPAQGRAMVEAAAVLQGQLMAAEAEEEGLKQIYTSNNVRVRSLESRIAELRHQLDLLGKAGTGPEGERSGSSENSSYPSIGKIPLLGVTYFDLFRRVKIQETLFEALTKRYEMAKVQEAKEIPTVRVLDPADVPERKATPKRVLILLFGVLASLAIGCSWIIGTAKWEQLDSQDSRKLFLVRARADLRRDWMRVRAKGLKVVAEQKNGSEFDS